MNEKRGSIRYAANATVSFKAEGDDLKVMQGQLQISAIRDAP